VYYTPDYIVAYMVEQSLGKLVQNQKPDDILKLRVIDTACGSGSFIIGAFAYLLQTISAYWQTRPKDARRYMLEMRDGEYHLSMKYKREILINCLYGVDIDPQAVEVAQLSLYLKLMEDETTHSAHHQQMEMGAALLPSLAANIVVGNSLVTIEDDGRDLCALQTLQAAKSLNFETVFKTVFRNDGFDLLIGNPPYIKEYTNKDAFDHVRSSPYYLGKMDIWYLFACRGMDWLKPETGVLAYIATNNWVTNAGAKKLRAKITTDARIDQLIDFGDFKVFRDAGIQTMILIAHRTSKPAQYPFDYRRLRGKRRELSDAQALLEKAVRDGCEYLSPTLDESRVPASPLTFSNSGIETLLAKIEAKRNFAFDGNKEVAQGIVPNPDVVSKKSLELIPQKKRAQYGVKAGQGVFVVDNEYFGSPNSQEERFLKPLYEPTEIDRYAIIKPASKHIIYSTRANTRNCHLPVRFRNHLEQYCEIMEMRRENQQGKIDFTQLHWPREERFFEHGAKILCVRKCEEPIFAYTENEAYVMMAFNVIKTERINLVFLTGLLNSRLIKFWLKHRGKIQGQNFQLDKEPLLAIPLCVPSPAGQERIARLVKRLIECKQRHQVAATDAESEQLLRYTEQYEMQLQEKIENLYDLTDDDRKLLADDENHWQCALH